MRCRRTDELWSPDVRETPRNRSGRRHSWQPATDCRRTGMNSGDSNTHRSNEPASSATADKDQPLREDIRLLGRLLGDTLREQEGAGALRAGREHPPERLALPPRRRSRREGGARAAARRARSRGRDAGGARIQLLLAARQHRRGPAPQPPPPRRTRSQARRPSRAAWRLRSTRAQGAGAGREALEAFFADALVSPVLTAHPTEVQRKSILDCQLEIARLLTQRDRVALTPEEARENEEQLRRVILTLWQTRILRAVRLTVFDEIENGLAYYRYTFLREVPRLYARDRGSARREPSAPINVGPVLQDRQLDRRRPRRQSLRHARGDAAGGAAASGASPSSSISAEVHRLGAELSQARRLVDVSAGARRARGHLARPLRAPQGRALPARGERHLRAARRHRARAAATSLACGTPSPTARRIRAAPNSWPISTSSPTRSRPIGAAPRRARPPASSAPRGAGFRLSPVPARHAPA